MRQNPSFAMTDVEELRRIIAANPWATLVGRDEYGMTASHYAVLLDPERDDLTIVAHVGRPDERILGLGEQELMVIFQGPHGYISPGWYGDIAAVPTRVAAKRKLSQNKLDELIENVILELQRDGRYANPTLAAEMQRAHDARLAARAVSA